MRASDLIERVVVDTEGHRLGQVHDLHVVCTSGDGHEPVFVLRGMIAGRGSFASRLGFGDHARTTKGPWLMSAVMRLLQRDAVYIRWQDVVRIEADQIIVTTRQR